MWRDPEEIRQSQRAYYKFNQPVDVALLRTSSITEKVKLKADGIDFIIVHYRDVLNNPRKEIMRVKKFINSPNTINKALQSVKPKENRFKKEELISGL